MLEETKQDFDSVKKKIIDVLNEPKLEMKAIKDEIKSREKTQVDMSSSLIGTKNAYLDENGIVIEFILTEDDIKKEQIMHKTEDPEVLFYKLLGKDLSLLLDDLRNEYKELIEQEKITEQDLDLYFRKAVNLFQVGEGI